MAYSPTAALDDAARYLGAAEDLLEASMLAEARERAEAARVAARWIAENYPELDERAMALAADCADILRAIAVIEQMHAERRAAALAKHEAADAAVVQATRQSEIAFGEAHHAATT